MTEVTRTYPILEDPDDYFSILESRNFVYYPIPENKLIPLGYGNMVGENELRKLRESVFEKAEAYGFPNTRNGELTKLDKEIGRLLFDEMKITPSVAASVPMWYFINLCLLPDFIFWRFGPRKEHFISDRRNYFGTQWWRYYLFCVFNEDPETYFLMTDRNVADLYERSNTCGYKGHINGQYIWFNKLCLDYPDKISSIHNTDDVFRKTLKIYGSKIAYRFYDSLCDEDRFELFKQCFFDSVESAEKERASEEVSIPKKRMVVRLKTKG